VLVVERCITLGNRFETIIEIKNYLIERQLINNHYTAGRQILYLPLYAALLFAESENSADIIIGNMNVSQNERLFNIVDMRQFRQFCSCLDLDHRIVCAVNPVDNCRRSSYQVKIELALESLLNNLHMEEAKKTAPEAETERHRCFRLVRKRGVIQLQLCQGITQLFILGGINRIKPGKNHRLHLFKAGKRSSTGFFRKAHRMGNCIADLGIGDSSDAGNHEAYFTGGKRLNFRHHRRKNTDF